MRSIFGVRAGTAAWGSPVWSWHDQTVYDEAVCVGERRRYQLGAKAAVT